MPRYTKPCGPKHVKEKHSHAAAEAVPLDQLDGIPPRFTALIAEVKRQLRVKLDEIENTALSDAAQPNPAEDVLNRYKARFCMSITDSEFDIVIFRFLTAHKEVPTKAVDALIATVEFRHRQSLDQMAVFASLIPIRGYDQKEVCRTLKLPFVIEHGELSSGASQPTFPEPADEVMRTEMDAFYSASYSDLFEHGVHEQSDRASPSQSQDTHTTSAPGERHGLKPCTSAGARGSEGNHASHTPIKEKVVGGKGFFSRMMSHLIPSSGRESERDGSFHQRPLSDAPPEMQHSFFHWHRHPSDDEGSSTAGIDVNDDQTGQLESSGREAADPEAALFMDIHASTTVVTPMAQHASPYINFHDLLAPIVRLLLEHVPMSFHYWDREGRPVLYLSMARLRSRALLRGLDALCPMSTEPKAVVMLYQAYVMEALLQLIRFRDRKNQRDNEIRDALLRQSTNATLTSNVLPPKGRVYNAVVIIDCHGVKMKHFMSRSLIQMAKPILTLVQRHYPETLHRLYVVNCQTSISNVYTALRGVMTEQTRRKIAFCDSESTPRTLKLVIDGDILPEQLGGRCRCFGSCLPIPPGNDDCVSDSVSACSTDGHTSLSGSMSLHREGRRSISPTAGVNGGQMQFISKLLHMKPRKHFKWSMSVMANEEIIWEYREIHHGHITFSVVFLDVKSGEIYEVVPRSRSSQGANHYIVPADGVLILEWSNRRSTLASRKVRIKLYRDGDTPGFDEKDNFP